MLPVEVLREETRHLHARLESRLDEHPLTTPQGYQRFLSMHGRVLPPIEDWLAGQDDFMRLPSASDRLRTSALREDLVALKLPMPDAFNLGFLDDSASVFGVCYVLEGSRLGAAYLRRVLASSGFPAAFLNQGSDQPLWRSFLPRLNALDVDSADMRQSVSSAKELFGAYLAALG